MTSINWKYEKRIFQVSAGLSSIVLGISITLIIVNWQYWPLITGFCLTLVFSLLNYFFLIYLTGFLLQKSVLHYKKLIFLLFFSRLLIYCLPILIVVLLSQYFNIFSALVGLIVPCLATFIVNSFDILKRSE